MVLRRLGVINWKEKAL